MRNWQLAAAEVRRPAVCRAHLERRRCHPNLTLAVPTAQMLDRRFRNDQLDQISQLCVPLISRQGGASMPPIGVLKCCNKMVANKVGVPFNDADVRLDVENVVRGSYWLPLHTQSRWPHFMRRWLPCVGEAGLHLRRDGDGHRGAPGKCDARSTVLVFDGESRFELAWQQPAWKRPPIVWRKLIPGY